MDWRDITDEREKYQAYLCSREWAEKKEAVHSRAGGKCERCKTLPIGAVHHLTYARKYAETLEDLAAWCNPCHAFTHRKLKIDPAAWPRITGYVSVCLSTGHPAINPSSGRKADIESAWFVICEFWGSRDSLQFRELLHAFSCSCGYLLPHKLTVGDIDTIDSASFVAFCVSAGAKVKELRDETRNLHASETF
jgi:hypothetical protein